MSNKIIILSTCFFLLVSFAYLATVENKQANINTKNIWMTYFVDPKNKSLDFSIENHSQSSAFHWQILENSKPIKEGDANISLGSTKTITAEINTEDGNKYSILVSSNNESKEIYKSL